MSQRPKRKKKTGKKSDGPQSIPVSPEVHQSVRTFNTFIAGARQALRVPESWVFNPRCTAFVPPPDVPKPEQPKKE